MADGRFVSKAICTDWELNRSVSLEADYLFQRCIPHLDREGRMPGHPGEVKAIAVPIRDEMTPVLVDECLSELAEAGLVLWYEVEGRHVLWFKGFMRHNKYARLDREAQSKLPPPTHPKLQRVSSVVRRFSDDDGGFPPEGKGREREVKGTEVNKKPPAALESTRASGKQQAAVEKLIAYVGELRRDSVTAVAAMPGTGSVWAQGLLGTWGPNGSMEGDRIPAAMRGEVVGIALERYATDRDRWYGRGFKAFVDRAYTDVLEHRAAQAKAEEVRQGAGLSEAMKAREQAEIERLNREAKASEHVQVDPAALVRSLTQRVSKPPTSAYGGSTA